MATRRETVQSILEVLMPLNVRARPMFGEYALYCDEKTVAFVCDDTLFIKPTAISGDILAGCEQAPAYPGSKDYYVVDQERLDDGEWLRDVIQRTADALPLPKPKKRKV
jgi:TfoX/Sxy family transcriptional regulator of competence genes